MISQKPDISRYRGIGVKSKKNGGRSSLIGFYRTLETKDVNEGLFVAHNRRRSFKTLVEVFMRIHFMEQLRV